MTTATQPSTARRILGYASGGLNCLVAVGFIIMAASSSHHARVATADACAAATATDPSCAEHPAAATQAPDAQKLRELVVAH